MKKRPAYSPEVRERAVQMVLTNVALVLWTNRIVNVCFSPHLAGLLMAQLAYVATFHLIFP